MTTAAAGYWSRELGENLRPSWHYLCMRVQSAPLRIVARSRGGKQMVCLGADSLHVLMFWGGRWAFVGGAVASHGGPVSPHGLCGVMMLADGGAEGGQRIAFLFGGSSEESEGRRRWRVGVLDTQMHSSGDVLAFRWVLDDAARRAMVARVQQHVQQRAADIAEGLGGRLDELMRADKADAGSVFRDFIPAYRAAAVRGPKLWGRPRFSTDRGQRHVRSATLSEGQEVTCVWLLIAVLRTVHGDPERWRVDREVMLLYRQTAGGEVLRAMRPDPGSRVAQMRRWLGFARRLSAETGDFAAGGGPWRGVGGLWARRRTGAVEARVRAWLEGGARAADVFAPLGAGGGCWAEEEEELTAGEWVARHSEGLRRQQAEEEEAVGVPRVCPAGGRLMESCMGRDVVAPFMQVLHNVQVGTLTRIHEAIPAVGPSSEHMRDEHLRHVEGCFHALGQNIGAHMRNCRGGVDAARKLENLMRRAEGINRDNERVLQALFVAAGKYCDDVSGVGHAVRDAMARLTDMACREVAAVDSEGRGDVEGLFRLRLQGCAGGCGRPDR